MLIPSIDLMGGRVVQLVHGEELALGFDDLEYWIDRFGEYPLVQLIDLDAAKRQGENRPLVEKIMRRLPCQVGGGIRTADDARELIESGAERVIFGSSLFQADPAIRSSDKTNGRSKSHRVRLQFAEELAQSLGTERLVFSVDTKGGRIAVRGWREKIALRPEEAMRQLEPFCGAFLYTHVDTEGTMSGFPIYTARELRQHTNRQLMVAGGIRNQGEIDILHALHVDAVAGMAVYTGALRV